MGVFIPHCISDPVSLRNKTHKVQDCHLTLPKLKNMTISHVTERMCFKTRVNACVCIGTHRGAHLHMLTPELRLDFPVTCSGEKLLDELHLLFV